MNSTEVKHETGKVHRGHRMYQGKDGACSLFHPPVRGGQRSNSIPVCRKFDLNLSSRKGLLSEDVEVRSVGAGGEVRRHTLDHTHFFTGQVQGKERERRQ